MSAASPVVVAVDSSNEIEIGRTDLSTVISGRCNDYRLMVRPRIIIMSAAAIVAGFVLASPITLAWAQMWLSVVAICCLVAASSVLNQVMESHTDARMNRTSDRPLAAGRVSRLEGMLLGIGFSLFGAVILAVYVNGLTSLVSVLTMLTYVLAYTPLKRISSLCTTVGAVPGAMPAVLGWLAAGGQLGLEALSLFALFFVWQFPHFLAIGWIYRDDYQSAGLKMLPSFSDEGQRTGWIALVYAIAFVPVSCLPRLVGLAGAGYLAAALVLSVGYLWLTIRFSAARTNLRARQLMVGSLICLPALLICLVADYLRLVS